MYFEVDDIKHRHNAYWDCYNVHGYIKDPDSSVSWNWFRGALAGAMGIIPVEVATFINGRYKFLKTKYEPPRNLRELGMFWDGIKRTDNFRAALRNRMQYAAAIAVFDLGPRFGAYHWFTGGYWSGDHGANVEFMRKILPTVWAALATGALAHPFEVARAAFQADATFPEHLQKGYTSYWNALRRIPQEEGLTYMSRGLLPTFMRNTFQTMFFFYFFDFWKDFFWPAQFVGAWPYEAIKVSGLLLASSMACAVSYPLGVMAKNYAELVPNSKDGTHPFNKNYRIAMKNVWYGQIFSAYFPGFSRFYYWRTMPWMFISGWVADDLGLFSHWKRERVDYGGNNTMEDLRW